MRRKNCTNWTAAAAAEKMCNGKITDGRRRRRAVVGSGRAVAVLLVRSRPGNIRRTAHNKQLVFVYVRCCLVVYVVCTDTKQ